MINPCAAGGLFHQCKVMQKTWEMTETLTNGYSSERTQRELSNEYQHDRVSMFFKNLCVLVLFDECSLSIGSVNLSLGSCHHDSSANHMTNSSAACWSSGSRILFPITLKLRMILQNI